MADDFLNFFGGKAEGNPIFGASLILKGNITQDMEDNGVPDTEEGRIFMGMTYVAATIPGSTITRTFASLEDLKITAKFPRNYVPEMDGEGDDAVIKRGNDSRNGEVPTFLGPRDSPDDFGDYTMENSANIPDPEIQQTFNVIVSGHNVWKTWFIDLLGSSFVKELTPGHVKSYCAWKGSNNVDGEFISRNFQKLKGGMPNVANVERYRGLMTEGEWKKYRLTFATTTGLLQKMLDECPEDFLKVFSDSTKQKVKDATAEYWSEEKYREIPVKALGILYAYLDATDQMVEELWGPKRAYDELSLGEKDSLRAWFTDARAKIKVYKSGRPFQELPDSVVGI